MKKMFHILEIYKIPIYIIKIIKLFNLSRIVFLIK